MAIANQFWLVLNICTGQYLISFLKAFGFVFVFFFKVPTAYFLFVCKLICAKLLSGCSTALNNRKRHLLLFL